MRRETKILVNILWRQSKCTSNNKMFFQMTHLTISCASKLYDTNFLWTFVPVNRRCVQTQKMPKSLTPFHLSCQISNTKIDTKRRKNLSHKSGNAQTQFYHLNDTSSIKFTMSLNGTKCSSNTTLHFLPT